MLPLIAEGLGSYQSFLHRIRLYTTLWLFIFTIIIPLSYYCSLTSYFILHPYDYCIPSYYPSIHDIPIVILPLYPIILRIYIYIDIPFYPIIPLYHMPSGKHTKIYGKSLFLNGKTHYSYGHFHSDFDLTRG